MQQDKDSIDDIDIRRVFTAVGFFLSVRIASEEILKARFGRSPALHLWERIRLDSHSLFTRFPKKQQVVVSKSEDDFISGITDGNSHVSNDFLAASRDGRIRDEVGIVARKFPQSQGGNFKGKSSLESGSAPWEEFSCPWNIWSER